MISHHTALQEAIKFKLENDGYFVARGLSFKEVKELEGRIGKKFDFSGPKNYPDLIAWKNGELLVIDIKRKGGEQFFIEKIENYKRNFPDAKIIIWIDIDTENVEIRGLESIY